MTKTATPEMISAAVDAVSENVDWVRGLFGFDYHDATEVMRDAINAALAYTPTTVEPITLTYMNWRGETAERTIIPQRIWFGSTDWHPDPQWLVRAIDTEKNAERDFALKDFGAPPAVEPVAVKPLEWRHDGHGSYCYCPVTDTRWTARNQHERDRSDERRAARIRSALDTPSTDLREENERLEAERAEQWRLRREMEASRDMERALAATLSAENNTLREALEPFGKLAHAVLSEAPADADSIGLFRSCDGSSFDISMDEMRAVCAALAREGKR